MATIMFQFQHGASREDMEAGLREIQSWSGIRHSGPLKPDARDPGVQRMGYADLEVDTEAAGLAERISKLPGVESVSIPTPRKLIF